MASEKFERLFTKKVNAFKLMEILQPQLKVIFPVQHLILSETKQWNDTPVFSHL